MRPVIWYFDFVSPFSYLCFARLRELPPDVAVDFRPVLFAGLLNHWGQKGPAELPSKRRYTYRWCAWWARRLGIPFRFPAAHPFNPLQHLRLAIACGCTPEALRRIFEALWTSGADAADPQAFAALARSLGLDEARLGAAEVKNALRRNTEDAAARGVFGVPTFEVDGELFWGADSLEFVKAFLADGSVVRNEETRRLDALPVAAARKV
ncbi:MAG: 2-hydroxychromene-2-carboxylate isomerase [Burkholderiales bacterium]